MEDIMKIVKSLEYSALLWKTIQYEKNQQKEIFFSMLLGTLGVSLLKNILGGKRKYRAGEGFIIACYGLIIKDF